MSEAKPRKFVLVIDNTKGLTAGELTKALQRTAGNIQSGRSQIEKGTVTNSTGKVIGSYKWEVI